MKLSDTLVGAGFTAAGALVVAGTLGYPSLDAGHPGPSLFPRLLGALLAALGVLLARRGLRASDRSERVAWRGLHRNPTFVNALFVVAAVVFYVVAVDRLGFVLTAALAVMGLMWRLGVPPARTVIVGVLLAAGVYTLFAKVLRVPLPIGLVWW